MSENKSPFKIAVLLFLALAGIVGILTGSGSPTAINIVYHGWGWLWNLGLVVGGIGTLVALWTKAPTNYLLERVGMIWLATVLFAYVGAILFAYPGQRAVVGVGIALSLAVACVARAIQVHRHLKRIRAVLAEGAGP